MSMIGTVIRTRPDPRWTGVASTVLAVLSLVGVAWVWLLTATSFDPADGLRIAGAWLVPVGLVGAVVTGPFGLHGPSRRWAITGLVLAGLSVLAFVALYNT